MSVNLRCDINTNALEVESGDIGNAQTYYYPFSLLLDNFNTFSIQAEILNTTLTFECTNGTGWTDVTALISGGAVTEYTTSGIITSGVALAWTGLRIKAVTTNATNSLRLSLARMRI